LENSLRKPVPFYEGCLKKVRSTDESLYVDRGVMSAEVSHTKNKVQGVGVQVLNYIDMFYISF
jgi:hypothetical protein